MVKVLLKKQMLELFSGMFQKSKVPKTKISILGVILLYMFVFGSVGAMFCLLADSLCLPLADMGYAWLYMALMGILSVTAGVFGSVFSTYTTLYQAKDNDMLLAMPVPVNRILLVRLFGVYVMGLLFSLITMIPALIVYFIQVSLTPLAVIFSLLIPVVLSFLVLSLSCILGWLVALVSSRMRNQKFLTVLLCLAFIAGYYYLTGNMSAILESILMNPAALGQKVKSILYPLYQMGKAAQGNVLSMLIFTGIIGVLFAAVYSVLHRSFLHLATTNPGDKKTKYVARKGELRSVSAALLAKEFRRFFGSVNYMLNCGLGIVFMVAAGVLLLVERESVAMISGLVEQEGLVAMVACAGISMMASMNDMTAPSVSLEGKNLWIVQVFPVSSWQVLRGKLLMHLILTLPPAAFLTVCVWIVVQPWYLYALLIAVVVFLFVFFMAAFGLVLNLKMPTLDWTNEVVPVKQSAPVALSLFGGWGIMFLLGGSYYFLSDHIAPWLYMIFASAVLASAVFLLIHWLKSKGSRILDNL